MDVLPATVAPLPPATTRRAQVLHGPAAAASDVEAGGDADAEAEAEADGPAAVSASDAPGTPQPASVRAEPACRPVPLRPESLHPSLWLGHQLARHADLAVATGFAVLDAQLPGGGWPRRALTELLLPHPGVGELRLLAPSLVGTQRAGRLVMLFDPPAAMSATALAQLGFEVEALLVVNTRTRVIPGADSLWALEQALKSGHVGAVLAWLPPRLRAERLRRLQLAAHAHDGPAFVMCETSAVHRPTAAPLRLALRPAGADVLAVRVLKRRGPLLESPISVELPPVLSATAQQRACEGAAREAERQASAAGRPLRPGSTGSASGLVFRSGAGSAAGSAAGSDSGSASGSVVGVAAGVAVGAAARSMAGLSAATFINLARG